MKRNNLFVEILIWSVSFILGFGGFIFMFVLAGGYYFYKIPFLNNQTLISFILGFLKLIDPSNFHIIIQLICAVILIFLWAAAYIVPGIICVGLADVIFNLFKMQRINALNSILYDLETIFKKEHKVRKTGSQWLDEEEEKRKHFAEMFKSEEDLLKHLREEQFKQNNYYYYNNNNTFNGNFDNNDNCNGNYNDSNSNQNVQSDADKELQKALAVFFFEDTNFTKDELRKARKRLMKVYHSDSNNNDEAALKQSQLINKYYELLEKYAK